MSRNINGFIATLIASTVCPPRFHDVSICNLKTLKRKQERKKSKRGKRK